MSSQSFNLWGLKVTADSFNLATSMSVKGYHITDHAVFLLLPSLPLLWMIVWSGTKGIAQVKIHLRHLSLTTLGSNKTSLLPYFDSTGLLF